MTKLHSMLGPKAIHDRSITGQNLRRESENIQQLFEEDPDNPSQGLVSNTA